MNDTTATFDSHLRAVLDGLLEPEVVDACMTRPDADWFELGLDSMRAFELIDLLAEDVGVEVDFGEFVRTPTLAWLREQAAGHAVA